MVITEADYVIVGAGSAGAALAVRLSQAGRSVVLLEAGGARHRDFWVRTPLGTAKILSNPDYVWKFQTMGQRHLDGRSLYWPRGKLSGGSSSVNGMIYVRGDPAEYDHWRDLGNRGWGYDDLLPYFKKLEATTHGEETMRGRDGPVGVTSLKHDPNPISDSFLKACVQAGIPENPDYNGARYGGVSYLQLNTRGGERMSTGVCYLDTLSNSNLTVVNGAEVTRILMENGQAWGVQYRLGDQTLTMKARAEVIVCAGPIRSPHVLELSGIGNTAILASQGIESVRHLPGVGENLIDHLQSRTTYRISGHTTLNQVVANPLRQLLLGAQYLITRKGLMATSSYTVHALAPVTPGTERPEVKMQIQHLSSAYRFEGVDSKITADAYSGVSVGFFQLRPESRGSVHLVSPDARVDPQIDPNYLNRQEDRQAVIAGFRMVRHVMAQPAVSTWLKEETRPGPAITSDEEILSYVKAIGQTSFHPIGTCKMGHDPMAVVDDRLRVHGVGRLRVVDSSIMPTMPSSNTNSPSMVIGERAASFLLQGD
jgi:choline dehydrogenase